MANLDETPIPSGDGSLGESCESNSALMELRLKELERENARLRTELAESREDARSYHQTLRNLVPKYADAEDQIQEVMSDPVPLRDALVHLERLLGAAHGN